MINQTEATSYVLHDLPELRKELTDKGHPCSIYDILHAFIRFTSRKVKEQDYPVAKQCFCLAGKLYEQGNSMVKCAVENVFVFSLDGIFRQAGPGKTALRSLVPGALYSAYIRQVMHGC